MNQTPSQNPLTETLQRWRVRPQRDPQFRQGVWRSVEARWREARFSGFLRAHALATASFLLIAVVVGAWTGRIQAREQAMAERDAMITAYVQSLDAKTHLAMR